MSRSERSYILHPKFANFWVNLHKGKLQELGPDSKIILDNSTSGSKYIIPFDRISSLFDLNDPSVDYYWRMWVGSVSSQPHVFHIQRVRHLEGGRTQTLEGKEFFDASQFFVPSTEASALAELSVEEGEKEEVIGHEFAMEDELEGFIYANWESIPFFADLEKFNLPESHPGRQVPTGVGTIDFLAKHKKGGQLVVIELKRNKSSDDAVGQILRYMGWVASKWAKEDHSQVQGVIICQTQDEHLQYAVSYLSGSVRVYEYRIKFDLLPADTIMKGSQVKG